MGGSVAEIKPDPSPGASLDQIEPDPFPAPVSRRLSRTQSGWAEKGSEEGGWALWQGLGLDQTGSLGGFC